MTTITPEQFNTAWNTSVDGALQRFDPEALAQVPITEEARRFLCEAGLPADSAPYLEFRSDEGRLSDLKTAFGMPKQYSAYWLLGSTGYGDPVCLKAGSSQVVCIRMDQGGTEWFINSSIPQFAEFLLVYAELVQRTIRQNGPDAFLESNIPPDALKWMVREFGRIDPAGFAQGTFWREEVEERLQRER
ncbi:SUKH-4 family immunity protein [Saccharibacillus kuerlensis]|uniref:SUKH-4 family immunity protein n=1 Tax=Saccharibacillus kuerlensis TaxID=459527 RepID=UPI00146D9FDD|nr:SUKH-4 family immunity protein [Saccharibacillus kuerlensis]